jgi:hypothetical protein
MDYGDSCTISQKSIGVALLCFGFPASAMGADIGSKRLINLGAHHYVLLMKLRFELSSVSLPPGTVQRLDHYLDDDDIIALYRCAALPEPFGGGASVSCQSAKALNQFASHLLVMFG